MPYVTKEQWLKRLREMSEDPPTTWTAPQLRAQLEALTESQGTTRGDDAEMSEEEGGLRGVPSQREHHNDQQRHSATLDRQRRAPDHRAVPALRFRSHAFRHAWVEDDDRGVRKSQGVHSMVPSDG